MMRYPLGDMPVALFDNIVGQLPDETVVVPFFRGESTLHPHFTELMPKLKRFREVQFASNGTRLTRDVQTAIRDNVSFFSLSLHRFTLPVQSTLTPFLHELESAGVATQVSIVDADLPVRWRGHFTRQWLRHVDRVRVYEAHSRSGFGSLTNGGGGECRKPFEDMVVYWDGKVGLCNHDWNNQTFLGDLARQRLVDVWTDTIYDAVRMSHRGGLRKYVPSCVSCNFESDKLNGELVCR